MNDSITDSASPDPAPDRDLVPGDDGAAPPDNGPPTPPATAPPDISFRDVVRAMFADVPGLVELRALRPGQDGLADRGFFSPTDLPGIVQWCGRNWETSNLYFGIATRASDESGTAENCLALPALFCDLDFRNGGEAQAREQLAKFPFPPTLVVQSGNGLHLYWFLRWAVALNANAASVRSVLRGIALAIGGDLAAAEPARVLRVPGSRNLKYADAPVVRVESFNPDVRYALDDFDLVLSASIPTVTARRDITLAETIPAGARNDTLYRLGRSLRNKELPEAAVAETLRQLNARLCVPPLDGAELDRLVGQVLRQEDSSAFGEADARLTQIRSWPGRPDDAVFRTRLGEYVQAVAPYTEADPVGIMAQVLVMFGNAVGRGPHFRVGADVHYLVLNVALVGPTASGRKGMAANEAKRPIALADPEWAATRIVTGLSTGEGLIHAVRDPIETEEPIKKNGLLVGYQSVITDPGVEDKRLLVIETEFARTLHVMRRSGSTLSATIRQAYDGGDMRVLTKVSPAVATGAQIGLIVHITPDEVRRALSHADLGNGFANRFLWLCVKRAQYLPDGGQIPDGDLVAFASDMNSLMARARQVGELKRTEAARELWASVYRDLSAGKPGLLGAATSRAEANTGRLACVYALADGCEAVDLPHLESALALWRYAEASATFIFGDALGDPTADTILKALRQNPEGLTRTEISAVLQRNTSRVEIDRALGVLASTGLARVAQDKTSGRDAERWRAL